MSETAEQVSTGTQTPAEIGFFGEAASVMAYMRSAIREHGLATDEELGIITSTIEELQRWEAVSSELITVIREAWKVPPEMTDATTLYLTAIMAGFASAWQKEPPQNGFFSIAEFPGIGKLEIEVRRVDGKAVAEIVNDLRIALHPFAKMDRADCDLAEVALQRGTVSDMTMITSGDFRRAREVLGMEPSE